MRCLVIGATGFVGSRLVPRLLEDGHVVRCLVRDPAKLARRPWAPRVEAVRGDMADPPSVAAACAETDAVFYLVHAMDGPGFVERDRQAAETLATAAAEVRRIVYLGGLQPAGGRNSVHLASRHEVGEILLAGRAPTAVLRAGIVVGARSAGFEMIRSIAESGPVLVLPDRAWNRTQPIGIDDVLHHLVAALALPAAVNAAFDVGGPDVLTFGEMVGECALAAGLPRPLLVPVPLHAPRLTVRVLATVLPVDRHLAGPLLESMAFDLVCHGEPPTGPPPGGATPFVEAARRALAERGATQFASERVETVAAPVGVLWDVLSGLGTGSNPIPGLSAVRGWGRWRIEEADPGRRLLLRIENRLPGTARLELLADADGPRRSRYAQRALFRPDGHAGRLYWRAQRPAREFALAVMARTVAGVATDRARRGGR